MLRTITILVYLCIWSQGFSQSLSQVSLVNDFFGRKGVKIIAAWAHPLSTAQSYSVQHIGHTYYLTVNYVYGSGYFNCIHRFELNGSGVPLNYDVYQCNATGFWKCFEGIGLWKDIISSFSEDEKDKIPRLIGKALEGINVIDACFGRLYYAWVSDGYFNGY